MTADQRVEALEDGNLWDRAWPWSCDVSQPCCGAIGFG